jgi:hypothetical protein
MKKRKARRMRAKGDGAGHGSFHFTEESSIPLQKDVEKRLRAFLTTSVHKFSQHRAAWISIVIYRLDKFASFWSNAFLSENISCT